MGGIESIRAILKDEFLKAYNQEIIYGKDCQNLSLSILQKTKRLISVTTLKRIFGIVRSPYNPSRYTLDTLALYLDYSDWDELISHVENGRRIIFDRDYWALLKSRIQTVTDRSLASLKAKIGDQFSDFQIREFAVSRFETFLNAPQPATAFIAPGGYGKTSIVVQLVELFFTGPDARYPNDIVCLVDGSILVNLINLDQEVVRLKNILELQHRNSFSNYFRKFPDQVRGRFILVIESLYQVYHQEYRLNQFIDNLLDVLSAYEDVSWFKMMITCRPANWNSISSKLHEDPHVKDMWFDVQIAGSGMDAVNVPLLGKGEVLYFLNKRHNAKWVEKFSFHYPDLAEVLCKPYMLQLFSANLNPQGSHADLDILDTFVSSKILVEPYLEEKSGLISAFFKLSDYAQQSSTVLKADLPQGGNFGSAYRDLVFNNAIYEFNTRGSYLSVKTQVKFSSDILLGFILANKWIEENGFDLALLKRVSTFYEANPMLRTNLLKCLIKMAFMEDRFDILSGIFMLFEGAGDGSGSPAVSHVHQDLVHTICIEMRKKSKSRALLIPHYAKSKVGQLLYFESFFDMDSLVLHSGDGINHYLENKQTDEAHVYGHFLKYMQYFLAGDLPGCCNEYVFFQRMETPRQMDPAPAAYYYGAKLIHQSVFEVNVDQNLMDEVFLTSGHYFKMGTQAQTGLPVFEYAIIEALNYGDCFLEIIRLSKLTKENYKLEETNHRWRNQLFLFIYARALLHVGEVEEAFSLYGKIRVQNIPVNYKYHVRLRFYLLRLEFLVFEKKTKEAKALIEDMKTISQMIRYKYFYDKALWWGKQLT